MQTLTDQRYDWGFACGRIAALEAQRLDRDFFVSLLGQARVEDLFRQLQELPVGAGLTPGVSWDDASAAIDRYYHDHLLSLRGDCPSSAVIDLFLLAGDYLNLKRALQGGTVFAFPPGALALDDLHRVAAGDTTPLDDTLRASLALLDAAGPHDRAGRLDAVIDGAYLRHLLRLAAEAGAPLVEDAVQMQVLGRAVAALWRAQRSDRALRALVQDLLPLDPFTPLLGELAASGDVRNWPAAIGGSVGAQLAEALALEPGEAVPAFEQRMANAVLALARQGKGQVFGPERVFSYGAGVMTEAFNLKVAVCGRLNRIDAAMLRSRLRETHG